MNLYAEFLIQSLRGFYVFINFEFCVMVDTMSIESNELEDE